MKKSHFERIKMAFKIKSLRELKLYLTHYRR